MRAQRPTRDRADSVYTRGVIQTSLSVDELAERLSMLVRPPLTLRQWLDNEQSAKERAIPFVGRISGRSFKFVPVITGRNSFIPVVTGHIAQGQGGAELRVVLRVGVPVVVFATGMTGTLIAGILSSGLNVPSAVLLLTIVGMMVGLSIQETRRVMRQLRAAFPPSSL
jgi:hypothetical protein